MLLEKNNANSCFSSVCCHDMCILILGSFPGERSLTEDQYYAHPRNVFWKIVAEVFGFVNNLDYQERIAALQKRRVGLWDVLQSCKREGSLDSNIHASTIITNDFLTFFKEYKKVRVICFNGSRAEKEFRKRVLPELVHILDSIVLLRLPSTSPAMATMNYKEKLEAWKVISDYL